jgi:hypothetical protein
MSRYCRRHPHNRIAFGCLEIKRRRLNGTPIAAGDSPTRTDERLCLVSKVRRPFDGGPCFPALHRWHEAVVGIRVSHLPDSNLTSRARVCPPVDLRSDRIGGAPTPCNRRDAERRIIDATYVLAEDVGMGGYQEVALRIGQLPVTLPSVEVDVTGEGGARARGLVQADVARLADAVLAAMKSPPRPGGLVAEFQVELLNADDPRVNDPAFLPRIYLDLDGGMHIRARTPD